MHASPPWSALMASPRVRVRSPVPHSVEHSGQPDLTANGSARDREVAQIPLHTSERSGESF